jgi:hypothetical protein
VSRSRVWIAVLIFAAALLPRLLIVLTPIPTQLDKVLPDDAYYYFLTAQNIVQSGSPSVDGLHPSNGWHPLWMLANTAIYSLPYTDLDLPVRLVLGLGAVCDSVAAVLIFLGARRFVGDAAGAIGGLSYAINTMPMFQSVNGLETGLAALCIASAWLLTLHLTDQPTTRGAALWGGIFGLTFLARTDTALILLPLGLYALWRLRRSIPLVVVGAAVALVVVAPWLLWNQANFGSFLEQSSSSAVPWAARARFLMEHPESGLMGESLRVLLHPPYWLRGDYLGAPPLIGFVLWPLALWGLYRARKQPLSQVALLLLLGGVALLLVHTLVRWYPRPWYFVVTAQSLAVGLSLFWHVTMSARLKMAALMVGVVGMVLFGWMAWQIGYYPWQQAHQYTAALWARDNLPSDARLASMNSGIIGYYSGRTTINLDGVVNPAALEAIQGYRLLDFMRENGVDYFLDSDNALQSEYAPFMGENYPAKLETWQPLTEEYAGLGQLWIYRVLE